MLQNDIYKKIEKHHFYKNNQSTILFYLYLCLYIVLFLSFSIYLNLNSFAEYGLVGSILFFASIYIIAIPSDYCFNIFLEKTKILHDKYQEDNIIYAVKNMPEEHELLNEIFLYIKEMKAFNDSVNLKKNQSYLILLDKIIQHKFNLRKKYYHEKLNELKLWLEVKINEYHISGYDINQNINNYFNDNILMNIFFSEDENEHLYRQFTTLLKNDKNTIKISWYSIDENISNFKENFITDYILVRNK